MYKISRNALQVAMVSAGVGSYNELAKITRLSVNTISRLNNGGSARMPTLQTIAKALNVAPVNIIEKEKGE